MKVNAIIRPAVKEDIIHILALIKELADYEKLTHQFNPDEKSFTEAIFGEQKFVKCLVSEMNSEIVGYAIYFHNFSTFLGKKGIYLEDLYVKKSYRGNGFGKALLNEIFRISRDTDCARVEWAVLDWNKSAIEFYENLGAEPLSDWLIYRMNKEKL